MMKNRLKRTLLLSALALCLAAGIAYVQQPAGQSYNKVEPLSDGPFGGPFELIDGNGQTVTDQDFAGSYRLLFFGFTNCPAVCPTELAKMADVLEQLGPMATKIQPIFISVDPERDTPQVVKDYVKIFDERIVGLTGSRAQIDHILEGYKIYATKVEMEGMEGEYMVDHSSFTYFMGPDGRLLALFKMPDTSAEIAESIKGWFNHLKS